MVPPRKLPRAWAVATGLWLWCGAAAAQPETEPAALLARAEQAERDVDLPEAERLYQRIVAAAPGSREARRARARIDYLVARADPDGGYAALSALERARRADLDRAAAERFAREVARMPDGLAKRESLFLLGEAFFRRLDAPRRALDFYDALLAAPAIGPEERALAEASRAEALADAGDGARAIEAMEDAGLGGTFEAHELRVAQSRAQLRVGSVVLLAAALALVLAAGRPWRAGRAGLRKALGGPRLLAMLYVVAAPAALSELYQRDTADTFFFFGACAAPVVLLASLSSESLAVRRAGRVARALTVAAVVAAPPALAFLVLDSMGGLASFGL